MFTSHLKRSNQNLSAQKNTGAAGKHPVKDKSPGNHSYQEKWIGKAAVLNQVSGLYRNIICLWDTYYSDFIYISNKQIDPCKGGASLEDGRKADFSAFNVSPLYVDSFETMNQAGIWYCRENLPEVKNILFSLDFLYRKEEQMQIRLLQQSMVVETDASGHPLLLLSFIQDITHLKKEKSANLVITAPSQTSIWKYDFHQNKLAAVKPFSEQEKKVLNYLSRGKDSREIAALLHISSHTADTHRRNLLHKTNCTDTTALITYARMTGLLGS